MHCHLPSPHYDTLQLLLILSGSDLILAYVILSNSKQISPAELQEIAADMFQMEAALFVPSGSMSNLIAGELTLCLSVKQKKTKAKQQLCHFFNDQSMLNGMMMCHYAVMVHCRERGDEIIVGDLSHVHIYEQGGCAQVSATF